MTELPAAPTRQALAIEGRSGKGVVSGKLKTALDLMIWEGIKRDDAAAKAGLKDHSLKVALRKPHVLSYFNGELAALRQSLKAKNIHRLDGIADASPNQMAKVQAIRTLEQLTEHADQRPGGGSAPPAGLTIVVVQPPAPLAHTPPTIDVTPRTPGALPPIPLTKNLAP